MITVADLEDQFGMAGSRPILYCTVCGAEYSAHKGDYFLLPGDHVFICCDTPMGLGIVRRTIEVIKE